MNKVASINYGHGRVNLVKFTYRYLIVNKPSGLQSDGNGNYNSYLLPQLKTIFQQLHPDKKINASKFQMVQRLDKYVTGGLIVSRDEKFTRLINKSLRSDSSSNLKVVRRYVGLVKTSNEIKFFDKPGLKFNDPENGCGIISFDIEAVKDRTNHEIQTYEAKTRFKILKNLKLLPTIDQTRDYPRLYPENSIIYPIIFELCTGRKNQIRDHVLQAFDNPLLNDDNFNMFKFRTRKDNVSPKTDVNSNFYKSNQIGLHSAFMQISRNDHIIEEEMFPIYCPSDRELWKSFIDEDTGEFHQSIIDELKNFNSQNTHE